MISSANFGLPGNRKGHRDPGLRKLVWLVIDIESCGEIMYNRRVG